MMQMVRSGPNYLQKLYMKYFKCTELLQVHNLVHPLKQSKLLKLARSMPIWPISTPKPNQ